MEFIKKYYDVVIVGGGMSGVCAAIACARHGSKTALIQNRPVLGGNASSEIRVHIAGALGKNNSLDTRETGILEEILLENRKRNPQNSYSIFDSIVWEKVQFEENLKLYLSTHMTEVKTENNIIEEITAEQLTTEKRFKIGAKIFVDATGDGTLAYLSGADCMTCRESKDAFGEQYALEKEDQCTMGSTIYFEAVDTGKPITFVKPHWANTYSEEDLQHKGHDFQSSGFFWVALGGEVYDTIADSEVIRDELWKAVYGIWDHIKNSGHHDSENYALEWVGVLPGKRSSRRVTGDYILNEQDLLKGRIFDDAVAYGAWPIDIHLPELINVKHKGVTLIHLEDMYTIPYRCFYSRNINNLMIAGRIISTSFVAFSSTRVMGCCAVIGQAVGTAAAMAIEKKVNPRVIGTHIVELQQRLIKDDCFIPGYKNEDAYDKAKKAVVTASSFVEAYEPQNIINGFLRNIKEEINGWKSESIKDEAPWVCLDFGNMVDIKEIHLKFDSNLSRDIAISRRQSIVATQAPSVPPELIKDYSIELYSDNVLRYSQIIEGNYHRNRKHKFEKAIYCNRIRINIFSTNGDDYAKIFEVRVY